MAEFSRQPARGEGEEPDPKFFRLIKLRHIQQSPSPSRENKYDVPKTIDIAGRFY